jgi:hypothetical protein
MSEGINPAGSGAAALRGTIGHNSGIVKGQPVPEVSQQTVSAKKPANTAVKSSGDVSFSVESSSPKGVKTTVTKLGVGGTLSFPVNGVPVNVGGTFTQKTTNGHDTVEFSAQVAAKFDTAWGKLTLTGGGKLDLKTNVLELSPGASLTVGDVKVSGLTTFNMKTGLMTDGNLQVSSNVTRQLALVQEINFDKKTVELRSGVTYKFGDPALNKTAPSLTALATYNLDTQEPGAQFRIDAPVNANTGLFVSADINNNGAGPKVILGGTHRF